MTAHKIRTPAKPKTSARRTKQTTRWIVAAAGGAVFLAAEAVKFAVAKMIPTLDWNTFADTVVEITRIVQYVEALSYVAYAGMAIFIVATLATVRQIVKDPMGLEQ